MEDDVDIVGSDGDEPMDSLKPDEPIVQAYNEVEEDELANGDTAGGEEDEDGSGDGEDDTEDGSGSGEDDFDLDIDAIGLELGESLWAGIEQTFSNATQQQTPAKPEQKLIPTIQRILTYLTLDQEMEATFKGSEIHLGEEATERRDVLSALRSLANTGVVDNDTASALARAIEEMAENPIFLREQTGSKRKRDLTDDATPDREIQIKEEE